nr:hypothetical protein [Tanacetum cinerariifolium]
MKGAAEVKNVELAKELESLRVQFLDLQVSNTQLSQQLFTLQAQIMGEERIKAAFEEFKKYEDDRVNSRSPMGYRAQSTLSCHEEILLEDAIAANISRAEKKKKYRVVCRTHGVGSAHHARSDGVPVSVPTVASQGLAILLADVATQTEITQDEASSRVLKSKSLPLLYNLDWPYYHLWCLDNILFIIYPWISVVNNVCNLSSSDIFCL